jgi:hypothetical protein
MVSMSRIDCRARVARVVLACALLSCRASQPVKAAPPAAPLVKALPEAAPPEDPAAAVRREVGALRDEARALLRDQAELYWKGWTTGETLDAGPTGKGHERLFSAESVRAVEKLRVLSRDPSEDRALRHLRNYLVGEILARETASASDTAAETLGRATISVDYQTFPFRDLDAALASELSPERRRRIWKAATPTVRELSGPFGDKERRQRELLADLGFPTYEAFGAELRRADMKELARVAEELLVQTEVPYRRALADLARETRLKAELVRRADAPRVFRAPSEVDAAFPRDEALPRLKTLLRGLGLDLEARPGVRLDAEPRPRKSPRALCVAVDVPSDVRLSVKPRGGVADFEELVHEAGHAVQQSLTREGPWEIGLLGGGASSEILAVLLENLVEDPVVAQGLGLSGDRLVRHVRGAAARRLYRLRLLAGQALFELAYRNGVESPSLLYRAILSRATGFALEEEDGERFSIDLRDFYASADGLRAAMAAAQVAGHLSSSIGPDWWKDARTGRVLESLLAPGTRDTAEEMLASLGMTRLDPKPLVASLAARFSFTGGKGPGR